MYKEPKISIEPIFESGGLIIGKKDKLICRPYLKTIKGKFKIPFLIIRKVEDIYYIKDDLHSLTVRCDKIRQEQKSSNRNHNEYWFVERTTEHDNFRP